MKIILLITIAALVSGDRALGADTPRPDPIPAEKEPGRPIPGSESDTPRPQPPRPEPSPAPSSEPEFIKSAAANGMGELKLAQLALTRAHDEKLRELSQTLIRDRTPAHQELKAIAEDLRLPFPDTAPAGFDEKYAELDKLRGAEFDKAFLREMAACHTADATLFEAGKKLAKAPRLIALIDKTLPVIRSHAEAIDRLQLRERPDATPLPGPGNVRP